MTLDNFTCHAQPHKDSGSHDTSSSTSTLPVVEMFCFGAPVAVKDRLLKLKDTATYGYLLLKLYVLLEVALGKMYQVLDRTGWAIADTFGKIEMVRETNLLYICASC
jgi:hypothetical protein